MSLRTRPRRIWPWLALAAALLLLLGVDDWSRDLTGYQAALADDARDPRLRPLVLEQRSDELIVAVRMAARRISTWDYVGEAGDGATRRLLFVRKGRLIPLIDDILVEVEDRGDQRVIRASSRGRLEVGDLGRNPRNLRRLVEELEAVLDGAGSTRPGRARVASDVP